MMFPRFTCLFSRGGSALVALALLALATESARAQGGPGPGLPDTLVSYHFSGATGIEPNVEPSLQQTQTASSAMRRGSGVTPAAGANAFAARDWSTAAGTPDTADYFSFRMQSYVGFGFVINRLGLRERRSLTGVRHFDVRSSADNFSSSLLSSAVPDNDSTRQWSINLLTVAPFDSILHDVEFRIYGYGAEAAAGTWQIDQVFLYGFCLSTGAIKPTVQFNAVTQTVAEAAATLQIPVFVTNSAFGNTTVQVALASVPGTATAGTDFTFTPQTLTFTGGGGPGGGAPQYVSLGILDDALPEGDKTVQLQLTNVNTGSVLGNPSFLTVVISANDGGTTAPTPLQPIASARPLTPQGLPTRLGERVRLRGIVAGPDLRSNGYLTTLIDQTDGIALLRFSSLGTQTMAQGDSLEVVGIVSQYNGLTQLAVDSFSTLMTNQPLPAAPRVVTTLDETTESELIQLANSLTLVSPLQWTQIGSSFLVDVTDGTTTYAMRVAFGTDVFNAPAPTLPFRLTGIGGQSAPTAPYSTDYHLTPRSLADMQTVLGVAPTVPAANRGLALYPNPTTDILNIRVTGPDAQAAVTVLNARGQVVLQAPAGTPSLRVTALPAGMYVVRVGTQVRRFVKQ